jgi:SpoIID/LytB domain protein
MSRSSRRSFLAWAAGALAWVRGAQGRASDPAALGPGKSAEPPRTSLFAGAPAPDDPLELLYSRRLSFDQGQPLITVRVVEGRSQISLRPLGPFTGHARTRAGVSRLAVPDGKPGLWTIKLLEGRAGVGASWVELLQIPYVDKAELARARAEWEARGLKLRVATVGDVYGIAGHVVDTRRYALLADGDATEAGARAQAKDLAARYGVRAQIHRELASRPSGKLTLHDPKGRLVATGEGALEVRCARGIAVEQVEYGAGYSFHGFERRTYPARLFACVDATGLLALVAALPMERLVKGVVPSEIFPHAHREALKAQAVTARGEVLAKVGARHMGDPYLLCAEQHCQVYKGVSAEAPGTDLAVDQTRGEALFARAGGGPSRLVDSVYSAVCGGFTEDNDAVWGTPADPSLRGRPDFDPQDKDLAIYADGIGEALVGRFVRARVPSYCELSGLAGQGKVRWTRSFGQSEVDELCAGLGVGRVQALSVEGRGVSGRARALRVQGDAGTARVDGELAIRRLFHNLNSGMFVVEQMGEEWVFTGGGWGHGSGMCQLGAIGRAQRGAGYRDILGWYYSGAGPERVY